MARSTDLVSGVKSELVGQIVTTIAGVALIYSLARLLGPERYGLFFLTISVLAFMKVFSEAGVANSGARYIAEYKERDPSQIPRILRISLIYNLVTICLVLVVLIGGHRYIAQLLNEAKLGLLLLYGTFFVFFGTLTTYTRVILQGFEWIRLSAAIHVLNMLGRFVFATGLVVLGFGVWGALTGYIIGLFIASMLGLLVLYWNFYRNRKADASAVEGLRRRIAEYTVPLTATSTAKALDLHIDTILIGFFLNPLSVGIYVLGKQITQFLETPVYAVGFSLAPTYGAEKARDNIQRAAEIYETSLQYSLLIYIPAAAGVILVAEPIIQHVFGTEYLGAVPVLQVLAIYVVFRSMTTITEHGLDYLGRARSRAVIKVITVVLNVLLNVLLIPRIGIVGAAVATVISYGMFSITTVYIIHTELDLRFFYLLKRTVLILIITAVMSASVAFGLTVITSPLGLLGVIILGGIIWFVLSSAFGLLTLSELKSSLI